MESLYTRITAEMVAVYVSSRRVVFFLNRREFPGFFTFSSFNKINSRIVFFFIKKASNSVNFFATLRRLIFSFKIAGFPAHYIYGFIQFFDARDSY